MVKWIKAFFFWTTITAVVVVSSLLILSKVYEKEIVAMVSKEINKNLKAPIKVSKVSLDLLSSFPYAAVSLNDAQLGEANSVIFSFEKIKLEFSLLDLIRKDLSIKRLDISQGNLHLLRHDDHWNIEVWEESSDNQGQINFNIENIRLSDVSLSLVDQAKLKLNTRVNSLNLHSENGFKDLASQINVDELSIDINGKKWLLPSDLEGSSKLAFSEEHISWSETNILIGERSYTLAGDYNLVNDHYFLNLSSEGLKIQELENLPEIAGLIPKELACNAPVKVKLHLNQASKLSLNLAFNAKDAQWSLDEEDKLHIESATGSLDYEESKPLTLDLQQFAITWNGLEVEGTQGKLVNLKDGISVESQQCIASIADKFLDLNFKNLEYRGAINLNFNSRGIFLNEAIGELQAESIFDDKQSWSIQALEAKVQKQFLQISSAKINLNRQELGYKGEVSLPKDLLGGNYNVDGYLSGELIDLKQLAEKKSESTNNPANPTKQPKFSTSIDYHFKELRYDNIELSDNIGKLVWNRNDEIEFKQFKSYLNGGSMSGDIALYILPNKYRQMEGSVLLDDIDISSLFKDFKEFGQDLFTHKNVDGQLDADLDFSCVLDPNMNLDASSLQARSNILIANGQLHSFPLFKDLAGALRGNLLSNALINIKKLSAALEEVEFETLSNRIEIENGNISFPRMAVVSNVFKLNAAGSHSIENRINYDLDFLLADALRIGSKTDYQNGKRIYVNISGLASDPKFTLKKSRDEKTPIIEAEAPVLLSREDTAPAQDNKAKSPIKTADNEVKGKRKPKWLRQEKEEKTTVDFDFSEEDF